MVKARLQRLRDSVVNRMLGVELAATIDALQRSIDDQANWYRTMTGRVDSIFGHVEAERALWRVELDDADTARKQLDDLRASAEYERAFEVSEPLVSVRIATYRNTQALIDVAIASVRRQSYERWEIVVVNDGPNDATAAAIAGLGEPRIRFEALPERGKYPSSPQHRWMVAGTDPANRAADLASGTWLAPLDDDDEFTDDHIETLLRVALEHRAELAYGALVQRNVVNATEARVWSDPPAISQFSFQGALYLTGLRFFQYDVRSWMLGEPADWNLIRRMTDAGVRTAGIDEIVAYMNMVPYTHKPPE